MTALHAIGGSFRDPAARVYTDGRRILRGVDATTLANFRVLTGTGFFQEASRQGRIVASTLCESTDIDAAAICAHGWAGVIEHERLPLVSYPYEWTFSMLKDAALLHLDLLEQALGEGWIIKDSTPYNIQFVGSAPIFIDIPSFVPRPAGDYWRGYRQFCMMFLYPLMLTAYRGIPFQGLLRGVLDGIPPVEAARFFRGFDWFKKGALAHVYFPAALERRVAERSAERSRLIKARSQSDAMVLGLVQSMRRIVSSLANASSSSLWSDYTVTHSYDPTSFDEKQAFVAEAASRQRLGIAWDLGSNTGIFSEIVGRSANHVVSVDSDHACVERFYLRLRDHNDRKILPLVMNLANPSPNQGWANAERSSFDSRNKPELILGLALIHHVCLDSNVPIPNFLNWLVRTSARLVIEFVDRDDAMVREMLSRKLEAYQDYNLAHFEAELALRYDVVRSLPLKEGARKIYDCVPR